MCFQSGADEAGTGGIGALMTSCSCVCFQSGADEAGTGGIGALIDRMKRLNQTAEEMSQEELVKRFEKVGALNAERKFRVCRAARTSLL